MYGDKNQTEISFLVNFLDKEATGYIKIGNLQKFMLLYT
jgi:hypothetical protein